MFFQFKLRGLMKPSVCTMNDSVNFANFLLKSSMPLSDRLFYMWSIYEWTLLLLKCIMAAHMQTAMVWMVGIPVLSTIQWIYNADLIKLLFDWPNKSWIQFSWCNEHGSRSGCLYTLTFTLIGALCRHTVGLHRARAKIVYSCMIRPHWQQNGLDHIENKMVGVYTVHYSLAHIAHKMFKCKVDCRYFKASEYW